VLRKVLQAAYVKRYISDAISVPFKTIVAGLYHTPNTYRWRDHVIQARENAGFFHTISHRIEDILGAAANKYAIFALGVAAPFLMPGTSSLLLSGGPWLTSRALDKMNVLQDISSRLKTFSLGATVGGAARFLVKHGKTVAEVIQDVKHLAGYPGLKTWQWIPGLGPFDYPVGTVLQSGWIGLIP